MEGRLHSMVHKKFDRVIIATGFITVAANATLAEAPALRVKHEMWTPQTQLRCGNEAARPERKKPTWAQKIVRL
jgi:hypothetical protein